MLKTAMQTYQFRWNNSIVSFQRPLIMGVLNATPDSFFSGSRSTEQGELVQRARAMQAAGADVLDLGGISTRPGSEAISVEAEWERLKGCLEALAEAELTIPLSLDTYRRPVAEKALAYGVAIINDVYGGAYDPELPKFAAEHSLVYVLTHSQGTAQTMQVNPHYADVVSEVMQFFSAKREALYDLGLHDLWLDPGFGFGKTMQHNYDLLRALPPFQTLFPEPILVGLSRKRMIQEATGQGAEACLSGTLAAQTLAMEWGAGIVRVHDVAEAVQCRAVCFAGLD
jgi:dihydropteroate synthase